MAVGLDIAEESKATVNPMSMFRRFDAADFGVPNAQGVQEQGGSVLRDSKPLPGEDPGTVAATVRSSQRYWSM